MLNEQALGWRGYVSSLPINGNTVPQRVQNLVIRDYARRHNLVYLLSATEYGLADCTMILASVLQSLDDLEGLIFYSTHQLPKNQGAREALIARIIGAGRSIHFALESLAVTRHEDVALLRDILMVRDLALSGSDALPFTPWDGKAGD